MNLSQLFNASARFQSKYADHLIHRFQFLTMPGARLPLEKLWVEPRGLSAALANETRLVITGAPGAGKTTTLAFLALLNARVLLKQTAARVPLYFAGRDLPAQALPRITDLPRELNLAPDLSAHCPRIFFPNVFNSDRALVLIDDADALPPEQLQTWLNEFKDARIIVTAQSALPDMIEFRLPGFRDGDIEQFANKWNAENAAAFLAALKSNATPRALTATPLTLTLLAQVVKSDQPLPARRADLFDAYLQTLGDWGDTLSLLESVALNLVRGETVSNDVVIKSRGFLRLARNRTAEFTHDLWQAYFAARAWHTSFDLDALANYFDDPASAWREMILFYAGLGDASELADRLVRRGKIEFAGRVIAHAREVRADLRDTVTQALIQRAWDGNAEVLAALSEMQSTAAVDAFAAKLKDKDPSVRTRAAEILGALELDRGIEYLLPQLRDVNAEVRDRVVEALGHARTDRVIEPLLVALRGDSRVGIVDTRMRVAAARALGEIASDKALPALLVELQIGEPDLRPVAANALKRMSSPLLFKPLRGIAQTGDEVARQFAAEVLAVVNGQNH